GSGRRHIGDVDKNSAVTGVVRATGAPGTVKLLFQGADEISEGVFQIVHAARRQYGPWEAVRVGGQQVRGVHRSRTAVFQGLNGDHHIEAKQGQVGEIIVRQGFMIDVRVEQA